MYDNSSYSSLRLKCSRTVSSSKRILCEPYDFTGCESLSFYQRLRSLLASFAIPKYFVWFLALFFQFSAPNSCKSVLASFKSTESTNAKLVSHLKSFYPIYFSTSIQIAPHFAKIFISFDAILIF